MLKTLVLALAASATLAGCATATAWVYDKPGVSVARLDHDLSLCRKEALRPYTFALLRSQRFDPEALNGCMERKGYAVRPAE